MEEEAIKEMSALDLNYLLKELSFILGAKIENIYQNENVFYFNLYIKEQSKKTLKIILPHFLYLTELKEEMPITPPQFCSNIRKQLKGAKIVSIEQLGFERIVKIGLTRKDLSYFLVIELFSTGNVILCNKEMKIIYTLYQQEWKDRTIKEGINYIHPEKQVNVLNITENVLISTLKNTKMDSIVTFLAKELGFGGKYAEKICINAKIDKKNAPKDVEPDNLFKHIREIITTAPLEMNSLLEKQLNGRVYVAIKENKDAAKKDKKNKIQKILEAQKSVELRLKEEYEENNAKGELIYKNYNIISEVLSEIKKAKTKLSWEEIKSKLKGNKLIVSIDDKKGTATVELN
jgi:predicted ribosome quality control (RQC) complex YloA/Tae2 family protein